MLDHCVACAHTNEASIDGETPHIKRTHKHTHTHKGQEDGSGAAGADYATTEQTAEQAQTTEQERAMTPRAQIHRHSYKCAVFQRVH